MLRHLGHQHLLSLLRLLLLQKSMVPMRRIHSRSLLQRGPCCCVRRQKRTKLSGLVLFVPSSPEGLWVQPVTQHHMPWLHLGAVKARSALDRPPLRSKTDLDGLAPLLPPLESKARSKLISRVTSCYVFSLLWAFHGLFGYSSVSRYHWTSNTVRT
jgi:hypothetical protein